MGGQPQRKLRRRQSQEPDSTQQGKQTEGGNKTRRAKRKKNPARERTLATKDKGMVELLSLMMKQLCLVSQQNRVVMAAQCDKLLLSSSDVLVKAVNDEGASFAKMVEEKRKRREAGEELAAKELRDLGPPTATLFVAFIRQLSTMDVGKVNRAELTKFLDAVEPQGVEEPSITKSMVEDWVTVCSVSTSPTKP